MFGAPPHGASKLTFSRPGTSVVDDESSLTSGWRADLMDDPDAEPVHVGHEGVLLHLLSPPQVPLFEGLVLGWAVLKRERDGPTKHDGYI